jgi:hypothetical protein
MGRRRVSRSRLGEASSDPSNNAWQELMSFKVEISKPPTDEQIKKRDRLTEIANTASATLNAHVNACTTCKPK